MSATVTSSGTWTPLRTDLTVIRDTARPQSMALRIDPEDIRVPPDEVRQMILLVQAGFGTQLAANARIDFACAAKLLQTLLQAFIQPGLPREGESIGTEV